MNNWRSNARACIRSDLRWPAATWSRISIPRQRDWDQAAVVSELNPGHSSTRDQYPATRPSCVSCVEMNFYIEMESSEASRVFIRRQGLQYTWIDTHVGSETATSLWSFESLLWGISSRFPLANHLALPGSELYLVYLRVLPMCTWASLSQDRF